MLEGSRQAPTELHDVRLAAAANAVRTSDCTSDELADIHTLAGEVDPAFATMTRAECMAAH